MYLGFVEPLTCTVRQVRSLTLTLERKHNSKGEHNIMDGMSLIGWIVIGGIAGAIASMVMHSRLGLVGDIIVGIVGAFVGGFLFNLIGAQGTTGFNVWSIFVAFVGAVILLGLIRMFYRNTSAA